MSWVNLKSATDKWRLGLYLAPSGIKELTAAKEPKKSSATGSPHHDWPVRERVLGKRGLDPVLQHHCNRQLHRVLPLLRPNPLNVPQQKLHERGMKRWSSASWLCNELAVPQGCQVALHSLADQTLCSQKCRSKVAFWTMRMLSRANFWQKAKYQCQPAL